MIVYFHVFWPIYFECTLRRLTMIYCNYISHSQNRFSFVQILLCFEDEEEGLLTHKSNEKKTHSLFFLQRRRDRKRKRSLYQREMNPIYEAFAISLSFSLLLLISLFLLLSWLSVYLLFLVLLYLSRSQFLWNSFSLN